MGRILKHFFDDDGKFLYVKEEAWFPDGDKPALPLNRNTLYDPQILEWLLRRCLIEEPEQIVKKHTPERIVLACCRGLWCLDRGQTKDGGPKGLVLWLLSSGSAIKDHRAEVLSRLSEDLERSARSAVTRFESGKAATEAEKQRAMVAKLAAEAANTFRVANRVT